MRNNDIENKLEIEKEESFGLREIFISFLILFLFLITWYSVNEYEKVYENLKESSIKTSNIVALQVHSLFDQIRNILIVASSDVSENQFSSTEKLTNYLASRNMLVSDVESLIFSDQNGNIVASSNESSLPTNLKDYNFFNEIKKNNTDIISYSKPLKSKLSNDWIISFNHRTYNARNQFSGAISAIVPMSIWYDYFRKQKLQEYDEINVIKINDCTLLGTSHKVNEVYLSNYINSEFCAENSLSTSQDVSKTFIDNKSKDVISYVTLPEYKIAIVSIYSHRHFLSSFYKKISIILLSSLLVFIGYWQLIKQQLKTEQRLKEKKVQMLNSSKMATLGEMASGIAHEVNNPLSIIKGRLQQIIRFTKNPDDFSISSIEKSATTALIATERIQNIVASMKSISRDNTNDQQEVIPLEKVFQSTMIFCFEKLKNTNIQLEVDPIPAINILCKESQISQVVLNLISNSSDAIENFENKWIKIQFELESQNKKVKILFTDSGNGIPEEVIKKMMEPFYTTKPIGKGTGLGLSISAKIIQEHNGYLIYNPNSPNTQFILTLPFV